MADNPSEYRFVIEGRYTRHTIPQARLAEYLTALADLYGQNATLYFDGLTDGSLVIKSRTEPDVDDEVLERIELAASDDKPAEVKRPYEALQRMALQDQATAAYIERGGAKILTFPIGEFQRSEAVIYGPFWQRGHLTGTVILLGGKSDPVSVKIQVKDKWITCKATRSIARSLRDYIWGAPVRVEGSGKWIRDEDGAWKLLQFEISSFDPIDDEPLTTTVARLRAIEGKWKDRPDPLAELETIRNGNDREG